MITSKMCSTRVTARRLLSRKDGQVTFVNNTGRLSVMEGEGRNCLRTLERGGVPVRGSLIIYQGVSFRRKGVTARVLLSLPRPPSTVLTVGSALTFTTVRIVEGRGLHVPRSVTLVKCASRRRTGCMIPHLSTISRRACGVKRTTYRVLVSGVGKSGGVERVVIPAYLRIERDDVGEGS